MPLECLRTLEEFRTPSSAPKLMASGAQRAPYSIRGRIRGKSRAASPAIALQPERRQITLKLRHDSWVMTYSKRWCQWGRVDVAESWTSHADLIRLSDASRGSKGRMPRNDAMSKVAEVPTDPRLALLAESLTGPTLASDDLVRFRPDRRDERVADLVDAAQLYDAGARARLRTLLSRDAHDTLRRFAQRRVLSGRRTANQKHFRQALSAWSLLPTVGDVPWTTWFLAALLLGDFALDSTLVTLFEGSSTPGGTRCQTLQRSLMKGGSLSQCHLVEVTTSYGVGMIELPLPRDVPATGWLDVPLIDRDDALYTPTMNLAQLAVDVANAFDHMTAVHTTSIQFSLLSTGTSPFVRTLGCLHFCAESGDSTWDVFVAQLESEADVQRLESNLSRDEGVAVGHGSTVVLIMAQPNFSDADTIAPFDTTLFATVARDVVTRHSTT